MSKNITQLAQLLGQELTIEKAQITTAESCTGGGIAEAITRTPGSSAWFEVGFITYSNQQKSLQLAVPQTLFDTVGAVSEEVVTAMVTGAIKKSNAQYGVAVSGVAGPTGGTAFHPVGTVWIAWYAKDQIHTHCAHFDGDRNSIREQTIESALQGTLNLIKNKSPIQQ